MIELKECCKVPFPEKLFEGYEIKENRIYANVNASKVLGMMRKFIETHNEPLFMILEIPSKEEDGITESKTLYNVCDCMDVYFWDGLKNEEAIDCLDALGHFLIKDGLNIFGFGGHESHEEILFGKYNVMTVYANDTDKYKAFFSAFEIEQTDTLVTAWDTFDPEHPGECTRYMSEKTGKTIFDIPEIYKEYGMYLYEQRNNDEEEYQKEPTFDELIGKVLLVGITYYTHNSELINQKQFYGTVIEANDSIIRIKQNDGSEFTLPPDLSSTKRARPGEYKLRSTGEVVVNPDFLATWNSIADEEN
jgi:hypothetical protein